MDDEYMPQNQMKFGCFLETLIENKFYQYWYIKKSWCVAVPNKVKKYDFEEVEKEENQANQEKEKNARGRSNRENSIQETTCWDKMVYKRRKRYSKS